jgi:hypothetical protein
MSPEAAEPAQDVACPVRVNLEELAVVEYR